MSSDRMVLTGVHYVDRVSDRVFYMINKAGPNSDKWVLAMMDSSGRNLRNRIFDDRRQARDTLLRLTKPPGNGGKGLG